MDVHMYGGVTSRQKRLVTCLVALSFSTNSCHVIHSTHLNPMWDVVTPAYLALYLRDEMQLQRNC